MQPYFRIFIALLFPFSLAQIAAQDSPTPRKEGYRIATDRPSIAYESSTVPRGIFQFESGFQFARNNFRNQLGSDTYADTYNIPNIVFRTGITDRWELHLGWDLLKQKIVFNGSTFQNQIKSNALTVASRVAIIDQADGWRPEMTFFGAVELPFTTDQPNDAISTLFRFCMQNDISEKLNVFYNLGADFYESSNGANSFLQVDATYALGANYYIVPDLIFYGEIYGALPYRNFDHTFGFDAGFMYFINDQVQLDAVGGFTINQSNYEPFFTLGFSDYLKKK